MSRRRTQLLAVLALAVGGGALTYVAFGGIEKNLVYYLAADELLHLRGPDSQSNCAIAIR